MNETKWTENVIVVDADYADRVTFDFTVNFERMLERRIPQADIARWVECLALDSGLRPGNNSVHVILIHDRERESMHNFCPGSFATELNGQAFSGQLGEFTFSSITTEGMATKVSLFTDTLELLCQQPDIKRLMVVPGDDMLAEVQRVLARQDGDSHRHTTLFAMQPPAGRTFFSEQLGYSLMAALGISSREIDGKIG